MASANAPTPTGNEQIARRSPEEVASKGDTGLIDEIYAEDILDHSPLGEVRGRGELKVQISGLRESFSDFSAMVEGAITEGDTVAIHVALRGTHDGVFMGIESTGKPIEIGNMVFTRIKDDVIAKRWVQPDVLDMLMQLSAVKSPTA